MPHEPEITEIAAYIANQIPTEGTTTDKSIDAWRSALRYARSAGNIEELALKVAREFPEDPHLQRICAEVAF